MIYKKIMLNEIAKENADSDSFIEIYLNDKNYELNIKSYPAMVVVPGGAYEFCSQREAEPVALRYLSEGFNCFVLHYSCHKAYPTPHFQLALLIDYINKNADDLNVNKKYISLVGFSAGGHLVSSYASLYEEFEKQFNLEKDSLRPFAIVLGYPVTSMVMETNSSTKKIITDGNNIDLIKKLSVPENISGKYPPTYLWTTKTDHCVPYEHSLQLADALNKQKVKYQFDLFEVGVHGGSLCNHAVYDSEFNFKEILDNRNWVQNSVEFIFDLIAKN